MNPSNLRFGFLENNTIRYSLYAAVTIVILALTGIFGAFAQRDVIQDRLSLDLVALVLILGIPALIVARTVNSESTIIRIANSAVAAVIAAIAVILIILLETIVPQEDLMFVFNNYRPIIGGVATMGADLENLGAGILGLIVFSLVLGSLVGAIISLPSKWMLSILAGLGSTVIIGLMAGQIRNLVTPSDALAVVLAFAAGYGVGYATRYMANVWVRRLLGFGVGAAVALVFLVLGSSGAFSDGGFWLLGGDPPIIIGDAAQSPLLLIIGFGIVGLAGLIVTTSSAFVHNSAIFLVVVFALLGMLNVQQRMTEIMAVLTFIVFAAAVLFIPPLGTRADKSYRTLTSSQKRTIDVITGALALVMALVAPVFMGQYITNVLDLVMLYIIMGIGLNVMVGYAGLLDLGYVASFAIGAYTSALLTTPSVLTTGCVPFEAIADTHYAEMCTGMLTNWQGFGLLTFWQAWPIAIVVSAFTGMALGVPVLRLRGDYLAIVTLGFGEMTRVLTRAQLTAPVLGAAQGISPVPFPVIDLTGLNPNWYFELSNASTIYYLYIFSVLFAALVVWRLSGSRLGRAWRAMKADEDVAQAMGVPLVRTKLLAFGVSSAFAGMGGAIFAAQLRGIFPDSFTLLVSINVLSLIIIGGLGSIPGVVVGALMLVGLPEVLRELQDYRLLVFGVLLVVVMLLKPEGLIPPPLRQLSKQQDVAKSPSPQANAR